MHHYYTECISPDLIFFLIYAVEVFLFKHCKRLHVFPSVVEGLQLLEPINISSEVMTYAPGTIMVDDD